MTAVPRALIIGASETAALLHLPVLARLRDAGKIELIEICDLRSESATSVRQRFGFARESTDAAVAIERSDIDLVYLFGGARMHHALGMSALRAGKHLFVEKPISPSYAEAIQLADAATARGLIAVGGHNRRFLSGLEHIRNDAGSAGWTFAEAVFHKSEFGRPPPFGAATWLSANSIHAIDALVFIMGGLPDQLVAETSGSGQVPSIFAALMRWQNGAQGVFLSNNEAGARCESYRFHAPGESWRLTDEGLTVDRDGRRSHLGCPLAGDGFDAEHDAFIAAVASGRPPRHAIAELAPSLFLAELIESGHRGPVRLPAARPTAKPQLKHSVLLGSAERLRGALGSIPTSWRVVSVEEIERSAIPRPDVSAAILGQGCAPLSAVVLDRLPNLQIVGVVALSLRRYGADDLLDRGILLVNASRAYAESVAEFALGLAILARRRAFASFEAMRRGAWGTTVPASGVRAVLLKAARRVRPFAAKLGLKTRLLRSWRSRSPPGSLSNNNQPPSSELTGALVGLIGWGANASAFARRLVGAGARVIVYSEHAMEKDIRSSGAEPGPLASVLAADIVSLHRGLSRATRHALGAEELARLRPGAVLLNVARAELIEPKALVARLARGDITACLDTFEQEPLPRRHALRRMPNVFLTSHIAGGSQDMHAAAAREVINKVAAHLDGRDVVTLTGERLAAMT
jgi:phosphoglycerate dehydrogenase-like enzyme/predicted dehydrogenase